MKEKFSEEIRRQYFQGRKQSQIESNQAISYLALCLLIVSLLVIFGFLQS